MSPAQPTPENAAVHPFVNAFANIGAIMGRDLGVIALRSIEAQRDGHQAVLAWASGHIPDRVLAKVPEDMRGHLYVVMLIPAGVPFPGFNFVDEEVQAAEVTIADGSRLVAFIKQPVE
jgi:hypothetical protein